MALEINPGCPDMSCLTIVASTMSYATADACTCWQSSADTSADTALTFYHDSRQMDAVSMLSTINTVQSCLCICTHCLTSAGPNPSMQAPACKPAEFPTR